MTFQDLKDRFNTNDEDLAEFLAVLEEKGQVVLYRKDKRIAMAKVTHEGLRRAHPPEYYRWFPSWVKQEDIF